MQALGGISFIFGSLIGGHLSELENGFNLIFYLISGMMATNFGNYFEILAPKFMFFYSFSLSHS